MPPSTRLYRTAAGPTLLCFDHLDRAGARHAVSTRLGGRSGAPFATCNLSVSVGDDPAVVRANRAALCRAVGADPERLCVPALAHGNRVVCADGLPPGSPALDGVDALMARAPGTALMVTCADCVPVLLYDPVEGVAGVAHAGWRGTLADVAGNLVRAMRDVYAVDPPRLLAGIGPGIGRCCYQVGPDVSEPAAAAFPEAVVIERRDDGVYFDLVAAIRLGLLAEGISAPNIAVAGLCTACRIDLFYSHRAERGRTGRFGAVIVAGRMAP